VAWIALAVVGAPAAHAQKRGNSAVDAAMAAERARQAGGTAKAPAPTSSPAPRPGTPAPSPAAPAITSTLDVGASGDQVKAVEQRLDALHYFVGPVDGKYDDDTYQAVMAFQKTNNMGRTGTLNQTVWSAMQTAKDPAPLVPGGGGHRVEIDLNRQVLFLYEGGKLSKIIAVSSGTSETPTPTGDYAIYSRSEGWETSALGRLYNSQYFTGGYAIHGSLSVPAEPASHGCVRIPMTAADWFPSHVSIGTPVYVR
jgi:peptidoglycan hydrolase-like protein with peptidoglycan-binding domain